MTVHQWLAEWSVRSWPWLANHLWQATLFSLIVLTVTVSLKRAPARARYTTWLLASLKLVIPSTFLISVGSTIGLDVASLLSPSSASVLEPSPSVLMISQVAEPIALVAEAAPVEPMLSTSHAETYCLLTIMWLVGFILFLGLWLRRRVGFSLMLRSATPMCVERENVILERVRARLGMKRKVRLLLSSQALETGVWGTWRPVVVLPEEIARQLEDDELETVITHELIHVARWDNLVSDVQMLLCCLFWFHPMVWLIDRKLLAERERACDERVIELGGSPEVYAKSLVKVFQVGLNWKLAGVSCATGSNLRRRIDRIMTNKESAKFAVSHRLAIAACVCALIAFSITAGLFAQGKVVVQRQTPASHGQGRVVSGVQGGVPGGVPGGVVGGVPGGVAGGVPGDVEGGVGGGIPGKVIIRENEQQTTAQNSPAKELILLDELSFGKPPQSIIIGNGSFYNPSEEKMKKLLQIAESTPDRPIRFENVAGAPLTIMTATAKVVTREQYERVVGVAPDHGHQSVDAFTLRPMVTLANTSTRRVVQFGLRIANETSSWNLDARRGDKTIEPGGSYTFDLNWPVLLPGSADGIVVKLSMAQFDDGTKWYESVLVEKEDTEGSSRRFTSMEMPAREAPPTAATQAFSKPVITYRARPQWTDEARQAGVTGKIVLMATFGIDGIVRDIQVTQSLGYGLDEKAVEAVKEIKFLPARGQDGEPIEHRATIIIEYNLVRGPSIGVQADGDISKFAISRPSPVYPPIARAARVEGPVRVEIAVDEMGNVTSVNALDGHPLLRQAAMDAAMQWKFTPHEVSGVPTKMNGTLVFNFKL